MSPPSGDLPKTRGKSSRACSPLGSWPVVPQFVDARKRDIGGHHIDPYRIALLRPWHFRQRRGVATRDPRLDARIAHVGVELARTTISHCDLLRTGIVLRTGCLAGDLSRMRCSRLSAASPARRALYMPEARLRPRRWRMPDRISRWGSWADAVSMRAAASAFAAA
jgi:hypothetical protein